jgi:hypothetical protein
MRIELDRPQAPKRNMLTACYDKRRLGNGTRAPDEMHRQRTRSGFVLMDQNRADLSTLRGKLEKSDSAERSRLRECGMNYQGATEPQEH